MSTQSPNAGWSLEKLATSINQLQADEIWLSYRIKPYYALGNRWDVDSALNQRRSQLARERVIEWIEREDSLRGLYVTDSPDYRLRATTVKEEIAEYDSLRAELKFVIEEIHQFGPPPQEHRESIFRYKNLQLKIDSLGMRIHVRDKLIDILSEFEKQRRTIDCEQVSVANPLCSLLAPTAAYLAEPTIQNSFLNRYIADVYLHCLQKDIAAHKGWWQSQQTITLAILFVSGLYTVAAKLMIQSTITPFLALGSFIYLAFLGTAAWRRKSAHDIVKNLITQFDNFEAPSTIDGVFLMNDLRRLQTLHVAVPSLLFSIFSCIKPGI